MVFAKVSNIILAAWVTVFCIVSFVSFVSFDMFLAYRKLTTAPPPSVPNLHVPDKIYGWKLKNNFVMRGNWQGVEFTNTIDIHGRKTIQNVGPKNLSIHIFGDSLTFGFLLSNEHSFPNIIAKKWLKPEVYVYNEAVSGYGIIQMYRKLLARLPQIRQNDLVIFAPISRDINRDLKDFTYVSQFLFRKGFFKLQYFPKLSFDTVRSEEIDTIFYKIKALLYRAPLTGAVWKELYASFESSNSLDDALYLMKLAKKEVEDRGGKFALFFLPLAREIISDNYDEDISKFDYYDIRSTFPTSKTEVLKIQLPKNNHWNRRGNEIAAAAIVKTLIENGLLDGKYLKKNLE